jgi:putative DNA methylase
MCGTSVTEYKRKLIEVALPLDAINKESAREKSIRHGHPSTLHLWWARRPLAACRAVLFASLVDDPSAHPERFTSETAQEVERRRLFAIIEELVKWDNSSDERVLSAARAEIMRSYNGVPPPIVDPFCGGGSIPLEAQRLGLEAHASDLNPVAVLITKGLIEIPPKFAGRPPINPSFQSPRLGDWAGVHGLAADVKYYGRWMREEAVRRIGHLYPRVSLPPERGGGDAMVIAWIWARIVKSPNPAWDGPMPLVRSFALSTRPGREAWVQPTVDRTTNTISYAIRTGPGWPDGTVNRTGATCLATGTAVPFDYVRGEGQAGRMGAELMAVVAEGPNGRFYLPPSDEQVRIARSANPKGAPEAELPHNPRDFKTPNYGLRSFGDLFTARQLVALTTFSDLIDEARELALGHANKAGWAQDRICLADGGTGSTAYADAIATYLAFGVDKMTDTNTTLCTWQVEPPRLRSTFGRQALPMTWDYAEANIFGDAAGDFSRCVDSIAEVLERLPNRGVAASVVQSDAASTRQSLQMLFCTDPPYYDNIGYADLSDFFYIWLRRSLDTVFPDLFRTLLTPKSEELVATPYRFAGSQERADDHFESGLRAAFARMRESQAPGYPLTIFYAFKQAEQDEGNGNMVSTGWETMLEGLLTAGLSVGGTWPMRSELATRNVGRESNALASSIILVCRPRPDSAALANRKEFLAGLKSELPDALRRLQQGNIAPVDLAQAAIGPGVAVFSRYSKVIEADGSAMSVRTALGLINQVLDETLAQQEGDFDSDTRWAVAWFEQFAMKPGDYGVAETLSKAKNSAVSALDEAGIVEARAGKVRLVDRNELPADWDPVADRRLTVWEVTQHLIRALETGGESAAAELVGRVGGLAETARELAYRLYNICERKRWAKEALSYNGLVVAWPAIVRIAAEHSGQAVQMSLGG